VIHRELSEEGLTNSKNIITQPGKNSIIMISLYRSSLGELANDFLSVVEVRDRRYRLRVVKSAFVGADAVTAMVDTGLAKTREEAVIMGLQLQKEIRLFSQISGCSFKDERLVYTLNEREMALGSWNIVEKSILKESAKMFLQLVKLENRYHYFRKYEDCFVGSEIVTSMVYSGLVKSRMEAVQLGRALEKQLKIFHGKQEFTDQAYFYQLSAKGRKMKQKVDRKAANRNEKKPGLETDFKQMAISKRIAKQLGTTYSTSFLANVEQVNKEMKEKAKTMYTGNHKVVSTGKEKQKKNKKQKKQKKKKKKRQKKKKKLADDESYPKTPKHQKSPPRCSMKSKKFGRLSSIKENSILKEITVSWSSQVDDGYSCMDCHTLNDSSVYTRKSLQDPIDDDDDAEDFDEYTVLSYEEYSEEETLDDEVPALAKKVESIPEQGVSTERTSERIKELILTDLWSDDVNVVRKALKELVICCDPQSPTNSCQTLSTVLEYGGIVSALLAMETYYREDPAVSFFGCLALERFFMVTTTNPSPITTADFKALIFEMGAMPLLLSIMKSKGTRNVQAYQSARWLLNILNQDSATNESNQ
jgi:Domain found in Dishevelled, Egl-10, and Pleckstrin (DEP)